MILFFVEALIALLLLVLMVWWTMFSGRKHGELAGPEQAAKETQNIATSEQNKP